MSRAAILRSVGALIGGLVIGLPAVLFARSPEADDLAIDIVMVISFAMGGGMVGQAVAAAQSPTASSAVSRHCHTCGEHVRRVDSVCPMCGTAIPASPSPGTARQPPQDPGKGAADRPDKPVS